MNNLIIENQGNEMILRLNRKSFDNDYLISLLKRLQLEELAQKSGFTSKILGIAEQINQDWWDKNESSFLKDIRK